MFIGVFGLGKFLTGLIFLGSSFTSLLPTTLCDKKKTAGTFMETYVAQVVGLVKLRKMVWEKFPNISFYGPKNVFG